MSTALVKQLSPYKQLLERAAPALAAALPTTVGRVLTPERITKIMLAAMGRTPELAQCSPESILKVCMAAAELGLEPHSPLGHLYAVPFRGKGGGYEAQPIIGYRGLITLARRSGDIQSVDAHVVYELDHFELEYGLAPRLEHKPTLQPERGEIVAAYCVATFTDGGKHLEVMTRAELDSVRNRSRAKNNGPWVTDTAEMYRKTVVRRASKYWPLSTELSQALEVDQDRLVQVALPSGEIHDAPKERQSHTARIKAIITEALTEEAEPLPQEPGPEYTNQDAEPEPRPEPQQAALPAMREPGEDG